jgi:hypothetical protein
MMRHTPVCGHCQKPTGPLESGPPHRWRLRGHNGEMGVARVWNNDPVTNPDCGPNSWPWIGHCPRCGWELHLGPPPWPRWFVVPAVPSQNQ